MNMKKVYKIVSFFMILMIVLSVATTVLAADSKSDKVTPDTINGGNSDVDVSGISEIGSDIVRVLTTVGVVASVIVLVVLGIKYMMGSAEEKAEYKKTLMPYVIGAVLVFAASSAATIIFNFASDINIEAKTSSLIYIFRA